MVLTRAAWPARAPRGSGGEGQGVAPSRRADQASSLPQCRQRDRLQAALHQVGPEDPPLQRRRHDLRHPQPGRLAGQAYPAINVAGCTRRPPAKTPPMVRNRRCLVSRRADADLRVLTG